MEVRTDWLTRRARLTTHEFLALPDDGQRHELIDGRHYVSPSPTTTHQRVLGRLYVALCNYFHAHPIGEAFVARLDVVLSDYDVVEPDVLIVLKDQSHIVTDAHVRGMPAIVVEILSPGTRRIDQGLKLRLYDQRGAQEYWVLDPKARVITVHARRDGGTLTATHALLREQTDALQSPLLPGFSLRLADLFPRA